MKNIISLILLIGILAWGQEDLSTLAERSGWKKTGRAEETEHLCKAFAKKYPKRVKCDSYGKTPEGRTLWYIQIQDGTFKNEEPVIWVQAGIHAGEIDGKDAFFHLMKNVFEKKLTPDPFAKLKVVFVPIVNLDGHERFGKWNRPNQIGPEEMGWRTTAQNYNLNRDFAKVDAPEMQAMNQLWNRFKPIVSLDLHVTDGAHFQPEVGIIVTPTTHHGTSDLHRAGKDYENKLMEKMKARGRLALPFYPAFENDEDPLSGFSRGVSPPRFANGYWFVRNRIGVLVESHSWKDYATRVQTHYDTILSTLEIAQQNAKEWTMVAKKMDSEKIAGKKIDVAFKHNDKSTPIEFPGYKYTITKSKVSGSNVIRYHLDKPDVWKVPFFEEVVPVISVVAPEKGYFIPASEMAALKPKFDVHGIKYELWKKPMPEKMKVFRAAKATPSTNSFEGHQTMAVEGEWVEEKVQMKNGVYFVPIDQPGALMALHLLEPLAPDSFVYWGLFNRFFEIKEYMEDYVVEDVALEMLKDKEIQKDFEEKLKDEKFSKDPSARFRFFYKKHSSWDERYSRYPIFKL